MKKLVSYIICISIMIGILSSSRYAIAKQIDDPILEDTIVLHQDSSRAYVNGKLRRIDNHNIRTKSIHIDGRIYLPIRFIAESMGVKVHWDTAANSIELTKYNKSIQVIQKHNKISVNGKPIETDYQIIHNKNRIFLPIRVIGELLDLNVGYFRGVVVISENSIDSKEIWRVTQKYNMFPLKSGDIKNHNIPVLMLHHFAPEVPDNLGGLVITPEEFESHLKFFKNNGYQSIHFDELYEYLSGEIELPDKVFMITMDDGYSSNYDYAFPLLKQYNTKATIFISTAYMGRRTGLPHFTWEEAKEMEESGLVDIQNHGHYHVYHNKLSEDELIENVMRAHNLIEENLGPKPIKVFAYPYFGHSNNTQKMLESLGFDFQITNTGRVVTPTTKPYDIKRINVSHKMTSKELMEEIQKAIKRSK